MKQFKKTLLSIVMLVTLLFTSVPSQVYAGTEVSPGSNQSGNATFPASSSGVMHRGAIIIDMFTIDNKTTSKEKEEAKKGTYSELAITAVDQYLYDYPEQFTNTTRVGQQALLQLTMKYNPQVTSASKYHIMNDKGQRSKGGFANVYHTHKDGTKTHHSNLGLTSIYDAVKSDSNLYNAFQKGKLALSQVQSLASSNSSQLDAEIKNFVYSWDYTEDGAQCIKNEIDGPSESIDKKLKYLNFLVVINKMCGETHWDVIENYLQTLNGNGSDKFSIVAMGAAVHFGEDGTDPLIYSLPSYYATATGKGVDSYMHITGPNSRKSAC